MKQQGFILIFVALILMALSLVSIRYFNGSIGAKKIAAYNRDAEESFMFAEGALNTVYGGFVYKADFNQDGTIDKDAAINLDQPSPLPNPYMYFVSAENKIVQTIPSILQRIADGEARGRGNSVNGAIVPATATTLKIDDLFGDTVRPILFTQDATGLQQVTGSTWANLDNENARAATWIEIIRDTYQPNRLYLFVQSMAQVGDSRSYIQRYIGEYTDTIGHQVSALTEANPHPASSNRERHHDD
ncbi:MAG: hypothetical protein OEZ43_06215 [Gammaproteobacteria bacterium]|nr:hypothetical protein [Gammaproteobacteria bacterium]